MVGATNGTEYFISGTPWNWEGGWPVLAWGGKTPTAMKANAELAKRFASANAAGTADFATEVKFVGKPGDTATWEVKVVSCTAGGEDPAYNGDNAKFDVTVSAKTFIATCKFCVSRKRYAMCQQRRVLINVVIPLQQKAFLHLPTAVVLPLQFAPTKAISTLEDSLH